MAVILNGSIITAPSLNAALRDGGTISGRFSQREVNQLAADLKAGSLALLRRFFRKRMSARNWDLKSGLRELLPRLSPYSVVVAMVGYYRFAGLVASCAVLFNIFIMWGVLQNLGAL